MIARIAAQMMPTSGPVNDKTCNNLMEIGHWAKRHAPFPAMIISALPEADAGRTWKQIRQTAMAIVDSFAGQAGTIESEESEIRTFILDSPDRSWQQAAEQEIFIKLGEDGYISLTRFGIRFSRDGFGLDSCVHSEETKGRYEKLLKSKT